jgi:hypothetical protein
MVVDELVLSLEKLSVKVAECKGAVQPIHDNAKN